jgi:hypothetical protein
MRGRRTGVKKTLRHWATVMFAAMAASIVTVGAQTPPLNRPPAPPSARSPVTGPAIAGTWSGTVIQVQSSIEYAVVLEITAQGAQTYYPELNCGGKLTRVGASTGYVFFVEMITRGAVDKAGRCSNGTVTVARAGDKLTWGWFGIVKGDVVVALGTLSRKS